jgi:hypothetical protein
MSSGAVTYAELLEAAREAGQRTPMGRKLPRTDVVIIGLGWTGAILTEQLTRVGLDVIAIERGPWRDTSTDFPTTYVRTNCTARSGSICSNGPRMILSPPQ